MARSLRTPGHLALMQVLIETRKITGMTQQDLARELGRPQSFIAKVETGERRLDVVEFIEWFTALKVDPASAIVSVQAASVRTIDND